MKAWAIPLVVTAFLLGRANAQPPRPLPEEFPQIDPQVEISSQVRESEELRIKLNEFAQAYNDLVKDLHAGLLPVKKASRVKELFEKLTRLPAWPIHGKH